jgi:hypothetical protein
MKILKMKWKMNDTEQIVNLSLLLYIVVISYKEFKKKHVYQVWFGFMVFNVTFNDISVVSWHELRLIIFFEHCYFLKRILKKIIIRTEI